MNAPRAPLSAAEPPTVHEVWAWVLTGLALFLVFPLHLFAALMAGLLVFELIHAAAPLLRVTRIGHRRAKLVVVGLLAAGIVTGLVLVAWKSVVLLHHHESAGIPSLLTKMAEILDNVRATLPAWLARNLPGNIEDIDKELAMRLRAHAAAMQQAGKEISLLLAHIVVGMVLGAILSLSAEAEPGSRRPLAGALAERVRRISEAFRAVVFAQVRISALNTFLTFLYLLVLLPAMGYHLPLAKTMVALTFVVGLLPVVGNLVSNTVIVIVSLSFSFAVAVWSLVFLIAVHKLEYFLNARIVGGHIHARTWELLLAMLVMESAFGLAGLIAAPIYYAYLKKELVDRGLV
uniref:Putative permease n=1 Tax=Desulfovibrio sp. U5L TaxID=596152 RepID=I2Q5C5_9BACT